MSMLDLHMHSNISNDGEFSPKKLMEFCLESNIKVAALADHNSVRGIEEAQFYAKEFGIEFIPAIELDCTFRGVDLHLLGYGINAKYHEFQKIEQDIEKQEMEASKKRIELIEKLGISFEYDELMKLSINGVITGEMIAEAALKDERNKSNSIMTPFYPGGCRSDNPFVNFYWDICSSGKPAYVPMEFISLKRAISIIYNADGVPVLAHPGNNVKENEEVLDGIIKAGIVGMEVYSSYHSKAQVKFYKEHAEKYNLIKTIGSDFHGKTKPKIKIGSVECEESEEKLYEDLLEKLKA